MPRPMARWMRGSCDAFVAGVAALFILAATPDAALAYVDPSVMTYTIQALAGVAVALSAVAGVAFRRTRRAIMKALHIDENAHKIVEPPVSRRGGVSPDVFLTCADERACCVRDEQRAPVTHHRHLSYMQRLARALVAVTFLVFTVFVVAPLEMVAGNSASLMFGFLDVAPLIIGVGAVLVAVLAGLMALLPCRPFSVLFTIAVALGVCCYLQALCLNQSLPVADGSALDLSSYKTITFASTMVWAVILVGALLLNRFKEPLWHNVAIGLSVCLVVIQGVGLVSLASSESSQDQPSVVTKEGLWSLSASDNVIVFVLDTFDTKELDHLIETNPPLMEPFTGFTYFNNSVGSMIPTRYAIPFLLTGRAYEGGDMDAFLDSWYAESTFLQDIASEGYEIGLYTDSIQSKFVDTGGDIVADVSLNIHPLESAIEANLESIVALEKMALYREAPWLLKPFFWFYTDEVNQAMEWQKESDGGQPYIMDDAAFYQELCERGLQADSSEKAFRFIHLQGPHRPYILDEDVQVVPEGTSIDEQAKASLKIVEQYLQDMKSLGIYDQATIIITADHGEWYLTDGVIDDSSCPILLVKPSEDASRAQEPLRVSGVPTGHADYAATVIDAIGGDSGKYGPTVFEVQDGSRKRYYWMTSNDSNGEIAMREFEVDGFAADFANWRLTGRIVPRPNDEGVITFNESGD